jgi:hypothetical protein
MPFSTAERRLRKAVIHELAAQLGKNKCSRCGTEIKSPEDLAIIHLRDWQDDPARFWDLTNIAFSHVGCEAPEDGQRQEETRKMKRVEVKLEDEQSRQLPGVKHEGKIYVAATEGERYSIRVKNTTPRRLLVVLTVDGRNAIDGEPGRVDGSGHVLEPFAEFVFKGWRQTSDAVAAFRFGVKEDSYSSQMGSPENVGIIGVAVFEEKKIEIPQITVREKEYVPVPYIPYVPWRRSHPWWEPWWMQVMIGGTTEYSQSGTGLHSQQIGNVHHSVLGTQISCSVEPSSASVSSTCDAVQALGTGYGETLASLVVKTHFARASEHPDDIVELHYDSLESLRKQGIMSDPPSRKPRAPSAFPEGPKVTPGYAPAPPRRLSPK